MSSFWSWWIFILTAVFLVIQIWILFSNRVTERINQDPNDPTTGHEFDGIKELENPMPKWWFVLFVATFIFGFGYLALYPGSGIYQGYFGWTQENQWEERQQIAEEKYGKVLHKYMEEDVVTLSKNDQAMQTAGRLFANNCALCHGSDARGATGFPNLTDNDWIYGGEPEQIQATLMNGRQAAMPAWAAVIPEEGVDQVADYVLSLSGAKHNEANVAAGETVFNTYCSACHQPGGKGSHQLGAPNLSDDIWLYSGSKSMIKHAVRAGRNGKMPAFGHTLTPERIHLLTAYVYGLSRN